MSDTENMDCENCDRKDNDLLYTAKSMFRKHGVEWVCEHCFKELMNISFEDFKEEHL